MIFQACIGPSAAKCHIRTDGEMLTLCGRTAPARDVTGRITFEIICIPCINRMAEMYRVEKQAGKVIPKCDTPDGLAQAIGLEAILP